MELTDLPIEQLKEATWNSNRMDEDMLARLRESIRRYGLIENLVVRPGADGKYEVLNGNQRLKILRELALETVPCVVVCCDDAHARLLAQALNHLHGEEDIGLRAELLRRVLEIIPQEEALAVLPETAESLKALSSMGEETIAAYLQSWQQAQAARLKHMQFQLTPGQLEVVEEALAQVLPQAKREKGENPNTRGIALYLLCRDFLKGRDV